MKHVLTAILLVLICSPLITLNASAKNIGTVGTVFDIVEPDALKEMQEKAANLNLEKVLKTKEFAAKIKNFKPSEGDDVRKIGPARKDDTFLVDMTYTLEIDIPDKEGKILYPKGYVFNPLDYITYPRILVIIDGNSPKQLAWFKLSSYAKDLKTTLLITDGSYYDLSALLKRPVFYATSEIVNIFRIKAVPSVVRQKGNLMEVVEVDVSRVKPQPSK